MISISVCNQKGGVGKTTSSIEIAAALSLQNRRVLVIDLDQQANLSIYVGADEAMPSIYECLMAQAEIGECIQHLEEFDLIRGSSSLSMADRTFVDTDAKYMLSDIMLALPESYDYVIIDNSPSRSILLTMAYVASDYVIVPTECDRGSQAGIRAIVDDIVKLRDGRHPSSHAKLLGIIFNRYEKTMMHEMAMEDIRSYISLLDEDIFLCTIRKGIAASETKTMVQSLQRYKKYSNPAVDFRVVVKEIISRCEEA